MAHYQIYEELYGGRSAIQEKLAEHKKREAEREAELEKRFAEWTGDTSGTGTKYLRLGPNETAAIFKASKTDLSTSVIASSINLLLTSKASNSIPCAKRLRFPMFLQRKCKLETFGARDTLQKHRFG